MKDRQRVVTSPSLSWLVLIHQETSHESMKEIIPESKKAGFLSFQIKSKQDYN
jgi:hypothetical protein